MTYTEESVISITPDDRWDITISGKNSDGSEWESSPQFIGWAIVVGHIDEDGRMRMRMEPAFIDEDGNVTTVYHLALYELTPTSERKDFLNYPDIKFTRRRMSLRGGRQP
jgi:hypothetical protein